jgi:hypothetical protein
MTPSFLIIVFQLAINNKATCEAISQWPDLLRLETSFSPLRKLLLKATVDLNPRRSPSESVHFHHPVQGSCFQLINFLWRLTIVYMLCIVFIISVTHLLYTYLCYWTTFITHEYMIAFVNMMITKQQKIM